MQSERIDATRGHQSLLATRAITALAALLAAIAAVPASAATLDRVRETGTIRLGYLADARPFSFRNDAGAADGYSVDLCKHVAEETRNELALPDLRIEWTAVAPEGRLGAVQQGNVDLLCTPASATLAWRKDVSFSIPVFAGGNRAVLRADAPAALREALAESRGSRPVWRGSPAANVLKGTSIAVVAGTSSAKWLEGRRAALQVDARLVQVADYRSGLQQLLAGDVDVFFGERSVVLGALGDSERGDVVILDRLFTHEPFALALARGDEDFRLLVDRSLGRLYASGGFGDLYKRWHGQFDERTRTFFIWNTPAE